MRLHADQITVLRLNLLRVLYLMNFLLLGLDAWPTLVSQGGGMDPVRGAAFSFWCALSLLCGLGLRYPLALLPLLLLQFFYKVIWLLAVALPQWSGLQSAELTQAMLVGVVLDVIVIPWPHVIRSYVFERGDRWKWKSSDTP